MQLYFRCKIYSTGQRHSSYQNLTLNHKKASNVYYILYVHAYMRSYSNVCVHVQCMHIFVSLHICIMSFSVPILLCRSYMHHFQDRSLSKGLQYSKHRKLGQLQGSYVTYYLWAYNIMQYNYHADYGSLHGLANSTLTAGMCDKMILDR